MLEDSDHRRQKGHLLSHTTDSGEHWSPLWGMHHPDQDVLGPYLISEATLRKVWELRGMQDWGQEWQPSGQWLSAWAKRVTPLHALPPCLLLVFLFISLYVITKESGLSRAYQGLGQGKENGHCPPQELHSAPEWGNGGLFLGSLL